MGSRYCSGGPSEPPYEPLREASLKHLTLKQSWIQLEDAVSSMPQCLIRNICILNLMKLVLHYISPQSLCGKSEA